MDVVFIYRIDEGIAELLIQREAYAMCVLHLLSALQLAQIFTTTLFIRRNR